MIALHASWGPQAISFCNPVLSCHSCALSWFACPIGVYTQYAGMHMFPFFALGTVLLLGVLFGRLFCGWVCPFGLVQDLLYKIPSRKFSLPGWTSWIKYAVLGILVVALPWLWGGETMASFCRICPASALEVSLPDWIAGGFKTPAPATLMRFGVLAVILIAGVAASRSFCRTLCPIAAILGPLNYISFWSVKPVTAACSTCGKCDSICPVGGDPSARLSEGGHANRDHDCIVCHECATACPMKNKTRQNGGGKPD